MRIIVAGGTGLVGRHVVSAAAERGHDVAALSRRSGAGAHRHGAGGRAGRSGRGDRRHERHHAVREEGHGVLRDRDPEPAGAGNTPTTGVGGEHPLVAGPEGQAVIAALVARGHTVSTNAQTSGASAILRTGDSGWLGGADPRREGVVLGGAPSR